MKQRQVWWAVIAAALLITLIWLISRERVATRGPNPGDGSAGEPVHRRDEHPGAVPSAAGSRSLERAAAVNSGRSGSAQEGSAAAIARRSTPSQMPAGAVMAAPHATTSGAPGVGGAPASEPSRSARYPSDRRGIAAALDSARPAIKECYAGWVKLQDSLAGTMRVKMKILRDPSDHTRGIMSDVSIVSSELGHAAVEGCVRNALSELSFDDPPADGIDMLVPYTFNSEGK